MNLRRWRTGRSFSYLAAATRAVAKALLGRYGEVRLAPDVGEHLLFLTNPRTGHKVNIAPYFPKELAVMLLEELGAPKPLPDVHDPGGDTFSTAFMDALRHPIDELFLATPDAPTQPSPGPKLAPTDTGFDIDPQTISNEDLANRGQLALHARLRKLADGLQASMPGIGNTHPALAAEFADYVTFLSEDMADLDVTSLWAVGTGLSEHIRALDRSGPGLMTPQLEPDVRARMVTLMTTHTAFIIGFPEGQELMERVIKGREMAEADPGLQGKTESVLRPMETWPHLLAEKAKRIVRALVRGFDAAPVTAFDLLTSSSEMARNGVYAFVKVLHPIILASEAAGFVAVLAGYENPEVLNAAALFLRDNGDHVAALFANDPQFEAWLAWAVAKLHAFKLH